MSTGIDSGLGLPTRQYRVFTFILLIHTGWNTAPCGEYTYNVKACAPAFWAGWRWPRWGSPCLSCRSPGRGRVSDSRGPDRSSVTRSPLVFCWCWRRTLSSSLCVEIQALLLAAAQRAHLQGLGGKKKTVITIWFEGNSRHGGNLYQCDTVSNVFFKD